MSEREKLFESMFDIAEKYDINLTNSPDMRPGVPEIGDFCGDIEAAVLAAGYQKPRNLTTLDEVNMLSVGSLIKDSARMIWRSDTGGGWKVAGGRSTWMAAGIVDIEFPATVLHEPS